MKTLLAALALVLLAAAPTAAQNLFDPTTIDITPSSDYNAQRSDGVSITSGVRVQYFLSGVDPKVGQPVMVLDLCKPPLTQAGHVVVTKTACPSSAPLFATPLLTNTTYFATSTQYGPGGESPRSPSSNFFALSGPPGSPLATAVR